MPMLVFLFFAIIVISRVIARALSVGFAFSFLEVNFLPMLVFFFAIIILSRVIARRRAARQRRQLRGRGVADGDARTATRAARQRSPATRRRRARGL